MGCGLRAVAGSLRAGHATVVAAADCSDCHKQPDSRTRNPLDHKCRSLRIAQRLSPDEVHPTVQGPLIKHMCKFGSSSEVNSGARDVIFLHLGLDLGHERVEMFLSR